MDDDGDAFVIGGDNCCCVLFVTLGVGQGKRQISGLELMKGFNVLSGLRVAHEHHSH
jgi:uncharacterized transporter YbjL